MKPDWLDDELGVPQGWGVIAAVSGVMLIAIVVAVAYFGVDCVTGCKVYV